MSKPRSFSALFLGAFVVLIVSAGTGKSAGAQEVTLRDRLVFGLKARHQTEVTFLEQVAAGVNNGQIPPDLVDGTFFWVRDNKPDTRFPFIYFERILRRQGILIGVPIPPYTGPYR